MTSSRFITCGLKNSSRKAFDIEQNEMMTIYNDLNSLDDWFLRLAMDQAEQGISIEDQLIPPTVTVLGQPSAYLYATSMFDGEVGNGGVQQFFDNSSGALAPTVRDALQDMLLSSYAHSVGKIIDAFGVPFPVRQIDRIDRIDSDPQLQVILDQADEAIDVWSSDYILAREQYALKHHLLK